MNKKCSELEELLIEGNLELPDWVAVHLHDCARCAEAWRLWRAISEVAPQLRKEWDSPELWPRIRQSLAAESRKATQSHGWLGRVFLPLSLQWQPVAAAVILLLTGLAGWMILRPSQPASIEQERRLLTEKALDEIERSERAYLKSIEKLSQLASPKVHQPESAVLASYREKLLLIDSAIGELRSQVERNRFNAHLRQELLLIYQEKQHTLEEVLKDGTHEN